MPSTETGRVLYFPYMRVPNNEWFIRVVLYWDEVLSIVPADVRVETLGNHVKELVDVKLVKPLHPEDYLGKIPRFKDAFLEYVTCANYLVKPGSFTLEDDTLVHLGKLPPDLVNELIAQKLAEPGEGFWCRMRSFTASQYMTYLAVTLSNLPEISSLPITDQQDLLSLLWASPQGQNQGECKESAGLQLLPFTVPQSELRFELLKNILPAPAAKVSARKLAAFKEKYHDQLVRFRREVEKRLHSALNLEDPGARREKILACQGGLCEQRDEIVRLMRDQNWAGVTFGVLGVLHSVGTAIYGLVTSGGVLAAALNAFGLISGVHSGTKAVANLLRQKKALDTYPMAYAALVQNRFGHSSSSPWKFQVKGRF